MLLWGLLVQILDVGVACIIKNFDFSLLKLFVWAKHLKKESYNQFSMSVFIQSDVNDDTGNICGDSLWRIATAPLKHLTIKSNLCTVFINVSVHDTRPGLVSSPGSASFIHTLGMTGLRRRWVTCIVFQFNSYQRFLFLSFIKAEISITSWSHCC